MRYIYISSSNVAKYTGHNKYQSLEKTVNELLSKNGIKDVYVPKSNVEDTLSTLSKEKLNLPKPLGNIYPMHNGQFIISNLDGLHVYDRNKKTIKYYQDIRGIDELHKISYNDGTITKNKLWIGLSHIKETKNLGYFGYLQNNKFNKLDQGFKVSNGPAVDEKQNKLYFSNSRFTFK